MAPRQAQAAHTGNRFCRDSSVSSKGVNGRLGGGWWVGEWVVGWAGEWSEGGFNGARKRRRRVYKFSPVHEESIIV